jgi:hypothetical protein
VDQRHAPAVEQLAALHRVGEVGLPAVEVRDVAERGGHAALGHHGVRLAQQRLADDQHAGAGARRRDRRPHPGAARPDHQDVGVDRVVLGAGHRQFQGPCGMAPVTRRRM